MPYQLIREYLKKNGVKLTWLADELKISISKLSLILHGKAPLYAEVLFLICEKLSVSSEIFNSHPRKSP